MRLKPSLDISPYESMALCSDERMESLKDLCKRTGSPEPSKHLTEQEERQFRSALQARMFRQGVNRRKGN